MKKLNLSALLFGATLFISTGVVTLNASDMKCGAGKCASMKKVPSKMKCGAKKCV